VQCVKRFERSGAGTGVSDAGEICVEIDCHGDFLSDSCECERLEQPQSLEVNRRLMSPPLAKSALLKTATVALLSVGIQQTIMIGLP
jgi:hypothetical protein